MVFAYLRARGRVIAAWALICLIFAVTFFLCNVPLWPVLYATLLSAFFLLLFALFDFLSLRRRHRHLTRLAENVEHAADALPEAESPVEADYQQILQKFQQAHRALEADLHTQRQAMMQYYTTWVHQIKTPIAAMRLLLQEREHAAPLLE